MSGAQELVCPSCGSSGHAAGERFCDSCGMPLVHAERAEPRPSDRARRARKIKPQYAQGQPVKVARAGSQAEAEFIAGLLLEEGIPSVIQRSPGSDVAEFLAAGARDVLVPESGAQAAREALSWERPADQDGEESRPA
jgi:hypothetical protein